MDVGPACALKANLEVELTPELQQTGIACRGDLTGGTRIGTRERGSRRRRVQIVVDGTPLGMVEDVVSFEPQLNPGIFGKVEVLKQ